MSRTYFDLMARLAHQAKELDRYCARREQRKALGVCQGCGRERDRLLAQACSGCHAARLLAQAAWREKRRAAMKKKYLSESERRAARARQNQASRVRVKAAQVTAPRLPCYPVLKQSIRQWSPPALGSYAYSMASAPVLRRNALAAAS